MLLSSNKVERKPRVGQYVLPGDKLLLLKDPLSVNFEKEESNKEYLGVYTSEETT